MGGAPRRLAGGPRTIGPGALHRALLRWYDRGRRDLPWRRARDPWRIWVSEVMLQQTRAAVVAPYYRSFLERFPTPRALAAAREPAVLRAWAGLGYYRRARDLRRAAQAVVREHGGRVPGTREAFARLPGVGRYTAGAVLSIAFGLPLPAVDGNVARVLSRWRALPFGLRDPAGARRLWALAGSLVPARRPGDWNQALMELGAVLCTPRAPRCAECPARGGCLARRTGRTGEFPPVPARRARVRVRLAVARLERDGRVLVARRERPPLAGLWEPPSVERAGAGDGGPALRAALRGLGIAAVIGRTGRTVRGSVTHRDLEATIWDGRAIGRAAGARAAELRWVDPARPSVALTALGRRVARSRPGTPARATDGPHARRAPR